jgi:hypothetical protein
VAGRGHRALGAATAPAREGRRCGLRSLFVGFETLDAQNLRAQRKPQNLHRDYGAAIRACTTRGDGERQLRVRHGRGRPDVFARTVEWAVDQGIETATFHILTPYPGTALFQRMERRRPHPAPRLGPLRHTARRLPNARHERRRARGGLLVRLSRLLPLGLDLARCARKREWIGRARHFAYAAGWKKFEPLWDWLIRTRRVFHALPLLESVLDRFGRHPAGPGRAAHPFARKTKRLTTYQRTNRVLRCPTRVRARGTRAPACSRGVSDA